jgi:hypothetical protein
MPIGRIALLVLAFPVGLAAYLATGALLTAAGLAGALGGLLLIFLPLFVAGVCAIPLLIPFFDFKAKQALANRPPPPESDSTAD